MGDLIIEKAVDTKNLGEKSDDAEKNTLEKSPVLEDASETVPESFVDPSLKEQSIKTLFITLGVIISIFVILFAGFYGYNSITGDVVLDIQGLHDANFQGDLDPEEGYLYNGFSFIKIDGLWWTDIVKTVDGNSEIVRIPLHFGAREAESVIIRGELSPDFNNGLEVYVAVDPTVISSYYGLGLSELSLNMAKGIGRKPIGSCTENSEDCLDRDIISCKNNPDNLPVVEFVQNFDVDSEIEMNGTCIKIIGNGYGIVKAVDRMLLHWYGII
jgi:hypothetical protein